jgi:hypothetical protein
MAYKDIQKLSMTSKSVKKQINEVRKSIQESQQNDCEIHQGS